MEDKKFEKYPSEELELRAKVGYQFDKVWKDGLKTRTEMQSWAIKLLKLKITPEDFSINKLDFDQVKVLGLKMKFEFKIDNNESRTRKQSWSGRK